MNQKTSRILRQYLIINKKMGYHPFLNSSGQETYMQGKDSNRRFKQMFELLSDKERNEKLEAMKRDIAAYRDKLAKPDFTEYKEKVENLREKLKKEKIQKIESYDYPFKNIELTKLDFFKSLAKTSIGRSIITLLTKFINVLCIFLPKYK